MFCPLCHSEYRPDITRCGSCGADLVLSLDDASVLANPRRLFWIAKDDQEFDLVASALRESQISIFADEGGDGLLGSLLRPYSKIYIRESDLRQALTVASSAISNRRIGSTLLQACGQCSAPCAASLSFCPECGNTLKAQEEQPIAAAILEPDSRSAAPGKLCPDCGATYPEHYNRCTVCGVELIPEGLHGEPHSESERHDRLVVVWRAGNPGMVSEAVALLRQMGIRHYVQATNQHMSFELAVPRPLYQICVLESDAERAQECLAVVRDTVVFASDPGPEFATVLERESLPAANGEPPSSSSTTSKTELWSGDDAAFADFLENCLFENRIAALRVGGSAGTIRISVQSSKLSAAKEILRELQESSPLE